MRASTSPAEVDSQTEMKSDVKKEIIFEAKLIVREGTQDTPSSSTTADLSVMTTFHHCKNCYELQHGFYIMPINS